MGKITKKELVAAYKELDKVVGGVEPAINHDELTADEFEKELYETVNDLVEEDDEFSEKTQKVFDYLAEKYGDAEEEEDEAEEEAEDDEAEEEAEDDEEEEPEPEPVKKGKAKKEAPVPAPKKGKAKPEPEPEEDDEDDDEEAEEEDLASVVKSTMKKDALHDLINENVEFKKKRKELLAEKSVFTLKKMMLDILGGGAPKAKVEKEPVKKEKPISKKQEKSEVEWPKGFTKGDTVTFQDRKGEKIIGKLDRYFWHKQSNRFWYLIISNNKNFYKHIEDVTKKSK